MALTFTCKACASITMLDANANHVLELIGKQRGARGVITAEEAPACIEKLKAAITAHAAEPPPCERQEPERAAAFVPLKARLGPFIEMLERADAGGAAVLWGV